MFVIKVIKLLYKQALQVARLPRAPGFSVKQRCERVRIEETEGGRGRAEGERVKHGSNGDFHAVAFRQWRARVSCPYVPAIGSGKAKGKKKKKSESNTHVQ